MHTSARRTPAGRIPFSEPGTGVPPVRRSALRLAGLALAIAGCLAGTRPAAALTLVDQTRTASARAELVEDGVPIVDEQASAAADFEPFVAEPTATADSETNIGAADAFHDSTITLAGPSLVVEAGGAALGFFDTAEEPFADAAEGEGNAIFELVFSTTLPVTWLLEGFLAVDLEQLDIHVEGGSASVDVLAGIELVGASSGVVFRREVTDLLADFDLVEEDVFTGGTLAPDTYTLRGFASALAQGSANTEGSGLSVFAFRFEGTVVPEPGTALLLAAGLAGLAARAGGRRARPPGA